MLMLPTLRVVDLYLVHRRARSVGIDNVYRELHHSVGGHNLRTIALRALDVVFVDIDYALLAVLRKVGKILDRAEIC